MIVRLVAMILLVFANLYSSSWQEPLKVSIDFVDLPKKILRFPAYDLKVGEFGFVVTKLTDYEIITSEVVVIAVENGVATARFKAFDSMKQRHLPTPRMAPKKGNLIYFRQFNNQAFLIAPNDELYEKIKAENPDTNFISSDLLVIHLNGFDLKAANLKRGCNAYSVGVVYIVTTNTLNILDCQSFEILEKRPLDTSGISKTAVPFFSRVEGVDVGTLGKLFSGSQAKRYFLYYDTLLKKEKRKETRSQKQEIKVDKQEKMRANSQKTSQSLKKASLKEEMHEEKEGKERETREERRKARATEKAGKFEEKQQEKQEKDDKETEERRKALEAGKK